MPKTDKLQIQRNFPPFHQPYSVEGMVIGNDLDALLSCAYLHDKFGWPLIAVYDYHRLWFDRRLGADQFFSRLKQAKYIAVDLDMYRNYLPSVGHHIINLQPGQAMPQHRNNLNPNSVFGISHQDFISKYPLATIHFLNWLFNDYPVLDRTGLLLYWLADSGFINAQPHRYRANVAEWLHSRTGNKILQDTLADTGSREFEIDMRDLLYPLLKATGLQTGRGQVRSRHLKLSGYQCQWTDPNQSIAGIKKIFELISRLFGWKAPVVPGQFEVVQGKRNVYEFSKKEVQNPGFPEEFLESKRVFSYVITNLYKLNYTSGFLF